MKCNKCNKELISTFYALYDNGTRHLVGECVDCGYRHLPYIWDDKLMEFKTGKWPKTEVIAQQKDKLL